MKTTKKIKKIISLLLVIVLLLSFVACKKTPDESSSSSSRTEQSESSSSQKPNESSNPNESSKPDESSKPGESSETSGSSEIGGSTIPGDTHEHTYSSEWSMDMEYHWREATCEHTDEMADKGSHSFSNGSCTVCSMPLAGTEGLVYELSEDGTYYILSDMGQASGSSVVIIPDYYNGKPVKEIGDEAFAYNTTMKTLYLPSTVEKIGVSSFSNCRALSTINFSEGLKTIGENAFQHCTSLLYVRLPDGLETISESAFIQSGNLHLVYVPKSVKTVGNWPFNICDELTVLFEASEEFSGLARYWDDMKMQIVKREWGCTDNFGETEDGIIWCEKADGTITICGFNERYTSDDGSVAIINISLVIPDEIDGKTVTGITNYAFRDITAMKKLVLPKTISKINNYALCGDKDNLTPVPSIEISSENPYYYVENNEIIQKSNGKIIGNNGAYIYFGEYPQTIKASSVTITSTKDSRGYYKGSDGEWYAKITAKKPYEGKTVSNYDTRLESGFWDPYTFTNGETVIWGNSYYFKVEPIRWRIMDEKNGKSFIICENVLSVTTDDNYLQIWKDTALRTWLNDDFYSVAFDSDEQGQILTSDVTNDTRGWLVSTDEVTQDKVYIPSYYELGLERYGFNGNLGSSGGENAPNRRKIATDYSIAMGVCLISNATIDELAAEGITVTGREGEYMLRTESYFMLADGSDDNSSHMRDDFGIVPVLWIEE